MEASRKRPDSKHKIAAACRLVTETFYGEKGIWLYQAFDEINARYFKGKLPFPLITLEITPHSGCMGWCSGSSSTPPKIAIHPSVFGGTEKPDPWGVKAEWLGPKYAFDIMVHECMHLHVHYRRGGYQGPSSHNNDAWIAEVNRLAPLMGFEGVTAGRQICKRVPVEGGEKTKTGKPVTKVKKVDLGNVSLVVAAGFPMALRMHRGQADGHYASIAR